MPRYIATVDLMELKGVFRHRGEYKLKRTAYLLLDAKDNDDAWGQVVDIANQAQNSKHKDFTHVGKIEIYKYAHGETIEKNNARSGRRKEKEIKTKTRNPYMPAWLPVLVPKYLNNIS